MKLHIFFLGLFSLLLLGTTNKTKLLEYIGQQCPLDMIFIKGNDSIASFFIGKSQETNMNYVIYLEWLKEVYQEYPGIAKYAEPRFAYSPTTELHNFNDPIMLYNLRHPALANYPVIGISWLQANSYSEWKTDRMNEYINLQINNVSELDYLKETENENNFNLEAYMFGQYFPEHEKRTNTGCYKNSNTSKSTYFLNSYRLPTEEELDFALTQNQNNTETINYVKYNYLKTFTNKKNIEMQNYLKNIEPFNSKKSNELKSLDNAINYNIGNNIKEWTIDVFEESKKHYSIIDEIFSRNNFRIGYNNNNYLDHYGYYKVKDSMGGMMFRIMGVLSNGEYLKVDDYIPKSLIYKLSDSMNKVYNNLINIIRELPQYKNQDPDIFDFLLRDTLTFNLFRPLVCINSNIPYRVVKSGTWINPSKTKREKIKEEFGYSEVGFRLVMQYNGFPIQTKYKANWRKQINIENKKPKVKK